VELLIVEAGASLTPHHIKMRSSARQLGLKWDASSCRREIEAAGTWVT
jgi:hypothetical protein